VTWDVVFTIRDATLLLYARCIAQYAQAMPLLRLRAPSGGRTATGSDGAIVHTNAAPHIVEIRQTQHTSTHVPAALQQRQTRAYMHTSRYRA